MLMATDTATATQTDRRCRNRYLSPALIGAANPEWIMWSHLTATSVWPPEMAKSVLS